MDKIPYMKFYPYDWMRGTSFMSLEAKGLYINLISLCWIHRGLPKIPETLARLLGEDQRKFRRLWPELKDNFIESSGRLWDERTLKEMAHVHELHKKLSDAGRKGGLSKATNKNIKPGHKPMASIPNPDITKKEKVKKEVTPKNPNQGTVGASPQTPPSASLQCSRKSKIKKTKPKKPEIDFSKIEGLNLVKWDEWVEYKLVVQKQKYKTTRMAEALAKYPFEVQAKAIDKGMQNENTGLYPESFVDKPSNGVKNKKTNGGGNGSDGGYGGRGGYATPPDASEVKKINADLTNKFRTIDAKKNPTPKTETKKVSRKPKVVHEKRALATEEEFEKEKERQLKAAEEELARRANDNS